MSGYIAWGINFWRPATPAIAPALSDSAFRSTVVYAMITSYRVFSESLNVKLDTTWTR